MKYTYTKASVNPDRLKSEIENSSIAGSSVVLNIAWNSPNRLEIYMNPPLSASHQEQLQGIVNAHVAVTPTDVVKAKILNAMDFGRDLVADYATKRVIRGAGIADTERVLDKLKHIQASILAGSLYVALDQLSKFEADADVPQSDIDEFTARIRKYLGI